MKVKWSSYRATSLAISIGLVLAGAAMAQQEVGALYGTVTDTDGTLLPGVRVALKGMGELKVQTSDERGQVRFSLPEGDAAKGLAILPPQEAWKRALVGAAESTYRVVMIHAPSAAIRVDSNAESD